MSTPITLSNHTITNLGHITNAYGLNPSAQVLGFVDSRPTNLIKTKIRGWGGVLSPRLIDAPDTLVRVVGLDPADQTRSLWVNSLCLYKGIHPHLSTHEDLWDLVSELDFKPGKTKYTLKSGEKVATSAQMWEYNSRHKDTIPRPLDCDKAWIPLLIQKGNEVFSSVPLGAIGGSLCTYHSCMYGFQTSLNANLAPPPHFSIFDAEDSELVSDQPLPWEGIPPIGFEYVRQLTLNDLFQDLERLVSIAQESFFSSHGQLDSQETLKLWAEQKVKLLKREEDEIKERIGTHTQGIQNLQSDILEYLKSLTECREKLKRLKNIDVEEEAKQGLRGVKRFKEAALKDLRMEGSSLIGITKPISIDSPTEDISWELGCYLFSLDQSSGRVDFRWAKPGDDPICRELKRLKYIHPHIGTDGTPCLGTVSVQLSQHIANNNLAEALGSIIRFLSSYNPSDSYVQMEELEQNTNREEEEDQTNEETVETGYCYSCGAGQGEILDISPCSCGCGRHLCSECLGFSPRDVQPRAVTLSGLSTLPDLDLLNLPPLENERFTSYTCYSTHILKQMFLNTPKCVECDTNLFTHTMGTHNNLALLSRNQILLNLERLSYEAQQRNKLLCASCRADLE